MASDSQKYPLTNLVNNEEGRHTPSAQKISRVPKLLLCTGRKYLQYRKKYVVKIFENRAFFFLAKGLSFAIYFLFLAYAAIFAMLAAIDAPTLHLDGAFQTASGLYRLDSGQIPGKDFFPYLGIGPLMTLYPVFKVFGSDLSASVISAQFMTLALGGLSVSVIWHLIFHPKSFVTSLAAGSVFFLLPIAIAAFLSLHLHQSLVFAVIPGNSLRPIRAVAPYLTIIIYWLLIFNLKSERLKHFLSGILTGLILLWSNDFAIPTAGLFAFIFIAHSLFKSRWQYSNLLIYFFTAALSWAALLALSTHGNPISLLEYNFFDVAKDQWWYFGPYSEENRIFSLNDVARLISQGNQFPLVVLALVALTALKTKKFEHILIACIGVMLFVGGALASVGGHLGNYFEGFYFWGVTVSFFTILRMTFLGIKNLFKQHAKHWRCVELAALIVVFFYSFSIPIQAWENYKIHSSLAKNDAYRFYVPELGAYLGTEWRNYIQLARQTDNQHVIEEYWGLWSATRKIFPAAWPVDSVIHALGRTRELTTSALIDAEIIISTRNSGSPEWQPWSLSQNFWFYDELLNNWTPYGLSPMTVVWHKNAKSRSSKSVDCYPGSGNNSLNLNISEPGFYRLELNYRFSGKGRHLLLAQNNLSFALGAGGYVSLNPSGRKVILPTYISQKGMVATNIKVIGSDSYDLRIISCASNQISFVDREVLHVPEPIHSDPFFTDTNWVRGVARKWAGFFVLAAEKSSHQYKPGRFVKLGNGDIRKIIRMESGDERYLNIYLDGAVLDSEKVGLPSEFTVIESLNVEKN